MYVAAKPRFAIVFLMILTLGLSLGSPAEDIPETAYDESETLPYESISPASIAAPPVAARTTQDRLSSLHLKSGAPSLFAATRVRDPYANRSTEARVSLTRLCTLLC